MVDRAIVQRKLATLSEYRTQLEEYATITVQAYRADWKIQRIVERTLQMMIELCADISGHVISDNGWSTPETYAETFRVLGEHAVLTPEQTAIMVRDSELANIPFYISSSGHLCHPFNRKILCVALATPAVLLNQG